MQEEKVTDGVTGRSVEGLAGRTGRADTNDGLNY